MGWVWARSLPVGVVFRVRRSASINGEQAKFALFLLTYLSRSFFFSLPPMSASEGQRAVWGRCKTIEPKQNEGKRWIQSPSSEVWKHPRPSNSIKLLSENDEVFAFCFISFVISRSVNIKAKTLFYFRCFSFTTCSVSVSGCRVASSCDHQTDILWLDAASFHCFVLTEIEIKPLAYIDDKWLISPPPDQHRRFCRFSVCNSFCSDGWMEKQAWISSLRALGVTFPPQHTIHFESLLVLAWKMLNFDVRIPGTSQLSHINVLDGLSP